MARLVGISCAVAVIQVLEGRLGKGLYAPHEEGICRPLREELRKEYGIEMVEKTVV